MGTGTQNLGKWVRWYSVFYSKYYKRTLVGKLKRAFAKTSAQVYNQIRAGDIKLFSLVGSFLTTKQLFLVMFDSFLFAAVLGMGKVVQLYLSQGGKKERFTKIHFSIEILLAVVYVTGRCVVAKN